LVGETVPLEITDRREIRLATLEPTERAEFRPAGRSSSRARWSWLGWLTGRNRRREGANRLVQGELLLRQVRPLRNDFREETGEPMGRRNAKLLYETPPAPERRDDQDHAWNRLRNRRPQSVVAPGE